MKTAVLGMLPLLAWSTRIQAPLLVCLPGGPPPARIDSALGPAFMPQKVMAFLRVRDLEDVLPAYPSAPIVTTSAYAAYLDGYTVLLKGISSQATTRYLLVSADPSLTQKSMGAKRVGILDFLGREKIGRFVEDAFGLTPLSIKRVSKREDLLSLMGLEAVDAVILEARELGKLRSETKMPLTVVMESKPIELVPVLVAPPAGENGAKQILLAQPASLLKLLGVEAWE